MGIRGGRGRRENLRVSCFLSFTAAEAIWRERLVRVKFFLGNCFVALQVSHVMSHDPVLPHPLYYLFQFSKCTSPSVPHPPFIMYIMWYHMTPIPLATPTSSQCVMPTSLSKFNVAHLLIQMRHPSLMLYWADFTTQCATFSLVHVPLVSWPARARLPARSGLVNEVEFLGLITQKR